MSQVEAKGATSRASINSRTFRPGGAALPGSFRSRSSRKFIVLVESELRESQLIRIIAPPPLDNTRIKINVPRRELNKKEY
jgi:hypothetical protein